MWFVIAQELLEGLDEVDWSERVKDMQRTWIGKSQGARFDFQVQVSEFVVTVKPLLLVLHE